MKDAIKNYAKFSVLGLDNVEVSEEDKKLLSVLTAEKESYSNVKYPNTLVIETYSAEKQKKAFNLKKRINRVITFKNASNWTCVVDYCYLGRHNEPVIVWHFENKPNDSHKVTVSRFVEIYKRHEFHNVEPREFYEAYLKPVSVRVAEIDSQIKEINDKYDALYADTKKSTDTEYYDNLNQYDKLDKEAKSKKVIKKDISAEDALKNPEAEKGLERVKSYWSTKLTGDEKARLMGWVAANIYSIRIYALLGGQSGNALSAEYGDMPGMRLREPEYNDANERTSQDSIGGYVYFKTIENAPIEIFEKIASNGRKFTLGGGTVPNRFADKNFALFLISEYKQYGFVPGKRNLYREIDIEGLRELFSDNPQAFEDGLLPF